MLRHGLYEQIINKSIRQELDMSIDMINEISPIDNAEASKVLSKYVTDIIEKGLDMIKDNGGDINSQVNLINNIVSTVINVTGDDTFDSMSVDRRAEQLFALMEGNNSNSIDNRVEIIRPQTSLAHSSLFTGAIHEPQMFSELKKEIVSSNRIDMLVSFIKWSGLRLIIDELTRFTKNGGKLRIITTSYMGATDVKAIEKLSTLPNTEIKISYDTKRTRLHAKTYVFYRETDFTTAYVGSSNLSNAAISSGLEWNVKIAKKDMADTIQKIEATFESYWNSSDFELYDVLQKERLVRALNAEKYYGANNLDDFIFDIIPYSYQQEILDKLEAERTVRGNYRNLIVAATGTGKTVISAFDYKSFRKKNLGRPCRLLFVAHREEILKQSLSCFRSVLKDSNFGEIFVGNYRPADIENLFISIQTFNSQEFTSKTTNDFYDYIVVDEFHHAAAPSYQILLTYYQPKILLGLTATPERKDGKSIIEYFNNRIAAEIRLPEAIDRKLLCPFHYFGVTDNMDLDSLKWSRGGYDKAELSNLYTINKGVANHRADMIIRSLQVEVMDVNELIDLEVYMLQMMQFTIWQKSYEECGFTNLLEGFCRLKQNPVIFDEMMQLLQYNYNHIDFLDASVDIGFNCPLDLHCSYTRDQLLVAMDFMKPASVREGVKYLVNKKIDIFFVTLNKSDKDYSPSTMYKDYSINETLFHWQSQSTTAENSPTGLRYINHNKSGNRILLFVREYKKNNITTGAEAYTYLGLANYVKHEGSRPMNITWKLDNAIPAKFLKKTNKLVG